MTRTDERLADLPMTPVECRRCHGTVRVRKAGWEQTSIQWDEAGMRACHERPPADRDDPRETRLVTCGALRESIARAVRSGALPMAGDSPLPGGRGPAGATSEERAVAQ
jgi:hypothetical protein